MKIYIASSFDLRNKIEEVSKTLEDAGHIITCKWWIADDLKKNSFIKTSEDFYKDPSCSDIYYRDKLAVERADILIFVAADDARKYNGANVELGMALAKGKACYSVGALQNSAMYFPVIRAKDLNDLKFKLHQHGVR